MTERNWQEDMDKVNALKHARSCVNIPKYQTMPSIETPYEPLEYWLQQYAALEREYERFQKAAMGWNDDLTAAESLIQQKDAEISAIKNMLLDAIGCLTMFGNEKCEEQARRIARDLRKLTHVQPEHTSLLQDKGDKL